MFRRRRLLTISLFATALLFGCGQEARHTSKDKVLVLGLDGAEWDLIHPMVDAGEMPNLARLMREGVYGNLRSIEPLAKSPAIWTTIATGRTPDEHGIHTFVNQVNGRPLTQNMRKVRALWNIFSGVGRTVGVVGWLMSWPAEEVNGFVVSDYLQYSGARSKRMDARTYPADLEQKIAPEVISWESMPWSFVERFVDVPVDTVNMSPEVEQLLRPIKWIGAGDITFARIGEQLYRERQPEFFAVYLRGMDAMGHLYWDYMNPDTPLSRTVTATGFELLTGAVHAYYRYIDSLIGPILDLADENTTIIVCSDHGFAGSGRGVEAHKLDGILVMAGNHVGSGEITGASVYDICPTVLALMGLPPAEDMRGSVLWSAFDESIPRERYQKRIATYETGERPQSTSPMESPVDKELVERLRALGYVD